MSSVLDAPDPNLVAAADPDDGSPDPQALLAWVAERYGGGSR
jgi:hypothetical protein